MYMYNPYNFYYKLYSIMSNVHIDKARALYIFRSNLTEAIKCSINHPSEIEHRQSAGPLKVD